MIKKSIITSMLALASMAAVAMPAKPGLNRVITLTDGTTVKVSLVGDEFGHYWIDEAGKKYLENENGIFSEIGASTMSAMTKKRAQAHVSRVRRLAANKASGTFQGTKKGLVILVQYTDVKFKSTDPKTQFTKIVNGENYSEGNFVGSVRDYFKKQSRGQFVLDFDVVGPVTLSHNMAYYGANDSNGDDKNAEEMVIEACPAVASELNFADYDWDGDGEAEQVYILYAGYGEADTNNKSNTVWPHEYQLDNFVPSKAFTVQGIKINTYACGNELDYRGKTAGIGTMCHEFSHCMGFPDIYDIGYSGNFGMGQWDLLSSGGYNGDSFTPSGYTGYERMVAGWLQPIEVSKDNLIDVTGMKATEDGGETYKITNSGNENEYFIIENRQQTGWDSELPGSGVMVTHVDYDASIWAYNIVNTTIHIQDYPTNTHQRLTLKHADNDDDSKYYNSYFGYTKTTYEGDLYPYNGNDSLTSLSVPSNSVYNKTADGKNYMDVAIRNIAIAADSTASMSFGLNSSATPAGGEVLFKETFDQCNGTGGNDGMFGGSIATSTFYADNYGWYSSKANGANKCAKFGSSSVVGTVTSPSITVDGVSTLTFRAAPFNVDDTALTLNLSGNATISPSTFTMTTGVWKTFTATITGSDDIRITFSPSKRFFLDDVVVTSGTTAVAGISSADKMKPVGIYTLDGTKQQSMTKGINIVKYSDGTIRKMIIR